MIDHINIGVADLAASRLFYERALVPLGYEVIMDRPYGVGFGKGGNFGAFVLDPEDNNVEAVAHRPE